MKCPYCGNAETKVLDSRDAEDLEITRRRRECEKCEKRFTTYERVEMIDLTIIKKDGTKESFKREKVLNGIKKACEKRPITTEQIEKAADEIERELRKKASTEIQSKVVGELVMKKLFKLDKVAYIRFASVYREFKDVDEFKHQVEEIMGK